jgi:energy-coupling factor transport system permease protein
MAGGFFAERESALHRLHPVTKIALLGLSFASALILEHPLFLAALTLVYAIAGVRSGVLAGLRRVWYLLLLVALASLVIWSFAYHGQTVLAARGPLRITREGVLYGAGMGLRLVLMAFCGLIFLAATRVEDFNYGLTRLGLPFAVSFALSLSLRLVPLFAETVRTIQDAQRARGLDPAGSLLARARGYVPLFIPVFATALRRTDQLAIALESKGFGLGVKRGSLREFEAGWPDALALILMALIIAGEAAVRYYGLGGIGRA